MAEHMHGDPTDARQRNTCATQPGPSGTACARTTPSLPSAACCPAGTADRVCSPSFPSASCCPAGTADRVCSPSLPSAPPEQLTGFAHPPAATCRSGPSVLADPAPSCRSR
eukprot:354069-Chlamydomonas_euryale.AAC.25